MGRTVLVLDDDALFRAMITPALEGRGFKVVQAGNGAQADAALELEKPDVLVVDGLLPDTSGIEWIAKVRRGGSTAPIIFASAFWRDAGTAKKLISEHRVAAIMAKPLAPDALVSRIEVELARQEQPSGTEEAIELSEEEVELTIDVQPFLEHPKELSIARMDAGRTLSSRIRELSVLLEKAQRTRDNESVLHAYVRTQKLVALASACAFHDVVPGLRRIEEALRQLRRATALDAVDWAALSARVNEALELSRGASRPGPADRSRTRRLLVVDEEASILEHVQGMVPRSLCEILTATHAEEAVRMARELNPDAALLDAGLPEVNGLELTGILRATPGLEQLPVGFIAGRQGNKQQLAAARDLGAVAFLSRPLARDTVIEAVCQLIQVPPPPRPRVIVVDEDAEFTEELSFTLARRGIEASSVAATSLAALHLHATRPDALVVSLDPGERGQKLIRELRRHPRWQDLPLIALGPKDFKVRRQALEAGADEALRKTDLEELGAVLRVLLDRAEAVRDRLGYDALTDLPLRRVFLEATAQRLADARRSTRNVTLCLMRVEGLEQINQEFGLKAGDELLRELGHLLREQFRAEDLRGRWSGATFIVLFQGSSQQTVAKLVERARAEFLRRGAPRVASTSIPLALSSGLSAFPLDGTTVVELLQTADERLTQCRAQTLKIPPWKPGVVGSG